MSVFSVAIPKRVVEESHDVLHLRQTRDEPLMIILIRALGTVYVLCALFCGWAWLSLIQATWFGGLPDTPWRLKVAGLLLGLPTLWFCTSAGIAGVMYSARFEDVKFDALSRTVTFRVARFPLFLEEGLWTKLLHFSNLAEVQVLPTPQENWKVVLVPKEGEPMGVDFRSIKEEACTLAEKIASLCDIPWRVVG